MADEPKVQEPEAILGDVGDTEERFVRPEKAEPTAIDRPRGPDGKFLPTKIEVPTPQAPDVPSRSEHPQYLLDAGRNFGLGDSEMAAMSTPVLNRVLWQYQQQLLSFQREQLHARTLSDQRPTQPLAEPAAEDYDLGITNPEQYDPQITGAMKKIGLESTKRIKELEARLAAEQQKHEVRDRNVSAEKLDEAFDALGEEFEEYVGKGSAAELAKTPAMVRRQHILFQAGINPNSVTDTPKVLAKKIRSAAEILSLKPAAKAAAATPNPYEQEQSAAKPRFTPEQWADAGLAAPTHRNGSAKPLGEERALENLTRKFRETDNSQSDSEIMDTLL